MALVTGFATRWPLRSSPGTSTELARSLGWLPLIGALVGALSAAIGMGAAALGLGTPAAAVMAVAVAVLASGGLHEDGWADVADGICGGWTIQRRLEIMKDSRLGTYGVLALCFSAALEITLLVNVPVSLWLIICVVGHAAGRCCGVVLMSWSEPARDDGGFNARLIDAVGGVEALRSFACLGVCLTLSASVSFWSALAIVIWVLLATYCGRFKFDQSLGGITGDCVGAQIIAGKLGAQIIVVATLG